MSARVKQIIVAALSVTVILVLTQLVLPGAQTGARGTPMAILFQGLVDGVMASLVAAGFVLIYRNQRILNIAVGQLGLLGSIFAYNLMVLNGVPFLIAVPVGVLIGGLTGFAFDAIFVKRFAEAPRLLLTVFSFFLFPLIGQATSYISNLPIFPPASDRTIEQVGGQAPINVPFQGLDFQIGGLPLTFGFAHIFALATSIAALIALVAFFKWSRLGIAVRASAENSERAKMLGIDVGRLSMVTWVLAGSLAAIAAIGAGSTKASFFGGGQDILLFIPSVAGLLARLRSIPIAVASSVGLAIVLDSVTFSYSRQVPLVTVVLFIIVMVSLLVQFRKRERSEATDTESWTMIREYRAVPPELLEVNGVRLAKRAYPVIGLLAAGLWPWIMPTGIVKTSGFLAVIAIVMLSYVIITGWAGQASVAQLALAAIGAVIGGSLTAKVGLSFWIAIFIVPLIVAGISVVVGLPALRIKGLLLITATFLFAQTVESALFHEPYFGWLLPKGVDRPTLFLLDFEDERSMYYLCIVVLSIVIVAVSALRKTRVGRMLIAVRDNEANVRSFGVNPVRLRIAAFALSGFVAGLAGVLLAHNQRAVIRADFPALVGASLFGYAVAGGVSSIAGVLAGTALYGTQSLVSNQTLNYILSVLLPVTILYIAPGGVVSLIVRARDSVLRIVAQRKQLIVPSLFEDLDPAVLEQRLIPLGEPQTGSGLSALPHDQRYTLQSDLYGRGGGRIGASTRRDQDAAAFGAAVAAVEDTEQYSVGIETEGTQ